MVVTRVIANKFPREIWYNAKITGIKPPPTFSATTVDRSSLLSGIPQNSLSHRVANSSTTSMVFSSRYKGMLIVLVIITSKKRKKAIWGEKPNLATAISTMSTARANQIKGKSNSKTRNNSIETGR